MKLFASRHLYNWSLIGYSFCTMWDSHVRTNLGNIWLHMKWFQWKEDAEEFIWTMPKLFINYILYIFSNLNLHKSITLYWFWKYSWKGLYISIGWVFNYIQEHIDLAVILLEYNCVYSKIFYGLLTMDAQYPLGNVYFTCIQLLPTEKVEHKRYSKSGTSIWHLYAIKVLDSLWNIM